MPRTCKVCSHVERGLIEKALVQGESIRSIAARFKLSSAGLIRHKQTHLVPAMGQELSKRETKGAATALDLLERKLAALGDLKRCGQRIRRQAEQEGDHGTVLRAIRVETLIHAEERNTYEFIAMARGEINLAASSVPQMIVYLPPGMPAEAEQEVIDVDLIEK